MSNKNSCCNNLTKANKEPDINDGPVNLEGLICYCFKHSKSELHDSIKQGHEEEIVNDIKLKMKDPGCFCETANPSGKCCLHDVTAFINAVKNSMK
jgi:hypothetical protein